MRKMAVLSNMQGRCQFMLKKRVFSFLRQLFTTLLLMVLVFQGVHWWQTRGEKLPQK
jgi:hypothetical protein